MEWIIALGGYCLAFVLMWINVTQNKRIENFKKLNEQHLDRLNTLQELIDRLVERNEQLEPGARLLDSDDTPILQDCKRDAKL